ncbi:unnamed protein product [Polarella glacialis]|uniref:Calcineurin-like phosphoesterase domain-containing protein n=2 Tax=Polarella glacialis TaxID=89957 RepID=A0A813FR68_POLGL|nr:unnamed protein product [Polarella glacialis]
MFLAAATGTTTTPTTAFLATTAKTTTTTTTTTTTAAPATAPSTTTTTTTSPPTTTATAEAGNSGSSATTMAALTTTSANDNGNNNKNNSNKSTNNNLKNNNNNLRSNNNQSNKSTCADGPCHTIRILHLSDTHTLHNTIEDKYPMPAADILVHTGDFTNFGTDAEFESANKWLGTLKPRYKHILALTGNHDWITPVKIPRAWSAGGDYFKSRLSNAKLLLHDEITVMGLRIFGSSWKGNQHGGRPTGFGTIPAELDILITHGPPFGVFDWCGAGNWGGSDELRKDVEQTNPTAHLFGHVHEQRGVWQRDGASGKYLGGDCSWLRAALCYSRNHPGHEGWKPARIAGPARLIIAKLIDGRWHFHVCGSSAVKSTEGCDECGICFAAVVLRPWRRQSFSWVILAYIDAHLRKMKVLPMAATEPPDAYEALYQPTFINVEGQRWINFGYALIGGSTLIMIFQALGVGPSVIWKWADDLTTVCFTIELLVRIFEKGFLFFTEDERNWNFFDSLVVAISLFSMIMAIIATADAADGKPGNSSAMDKMKGLRTLRLLRLLRLFRVLKGVEEVNNFVEVLLNSVRMVFLGLIVAAAAAAILATIAVSVGAGAKSWLSHHKLPSMPKID